MAGAGQGGQTVAPNLNTATAGALYGAGAGTAQAMGFQPGMVGRPNAPYYGGQAQMVGTGGTTPQVQSGQLANTNLAQYQNPYTQQVIDTQAQDVLRNAQLGLNQLSGQAQRAGAFGGSRHGVAMGEIGRGVAQTLGQQSAQLRQAGFQNAQQMAQQDIASRMQADLANEQASANDLSRQLQAQGMNQQAAENQAQRMLQASTTGAQLGMQGALANQQAGLQGAQMRLGASQQMGDLANLGFGMSNTIQDRMLQQGAMQRALNQQLMDTAQQRYAEYQGLPQQTIGYVSQALGASPIPQSQTTTKQPGLFDYLTLGATMKASDIRLKKNITKVGKLKNGLNIYKWEWKSFAKTLGMPLKTTIGVMAQEVQKLKPEAVHEHESGYLMVDYGAL